MIMVGIVLQTTTVPEVILISGVIIEKEKVVDLGSLTIFCSRCFTSVCGVNIGQMLYVSPIWCFKNV